MFSWLDRRAESETYIAYVCCKPDDINLYMT